MARAGLAEIEAHEKGGTGEEGGGEANGNMRWHKSGAEHVVCTCQGPEQMMKLFTKKQLPA